jgi:hypothetical protein
MKKIKFITLIAAILVAGVSFTSCEEDEDPKAIVSWNSIGDSLSGDVTGEGGSISKSYTWNNPLATADYNMDITAASGGSFNFKITDSEGTIVLNQTLTAGVGEDSKSGVTSSGASGQWTITVTLINFFGDGSFSLSPGN